MFSIAICDDNNNDRFSLKNALFNIPQTICKEKIDVSEFTSGEDLLDHYINSQPKFDIIFSDMLMNTINGIETARQIHKIDEQVKIVFVTISKEYAVDSYNVDAYGYLLKPVKQEKINNIISKCLKTISPNSTLYFHIGNSVGRCDHSDIVYIESNNHNIIIHCKNKKAIEFRERLSSIENNLNDARFLRCHQSYLVNMDHIIHSSDTFQMDNGDIVLIKLRDKKNITEKYYNWLFRND